MILFVCLALILEAQCPLCKQNVQAGLETGSKTGLGLNTGILYLLAVPYTLAMIAGIWFYKNRKKL